MPQPVDLGGGRWRVRVFLGRDPITGRQQTRTFTYEAKGVRAARVKAGELERQARQAAPGHHRITLGEAAETWFEQWHTSKPKAARTVKEYRRRLDKDIATTALWSTPVERIGVTEVDRFYRHLHNDRGFDPQSVLRVHAILSQVFKWLIPRGVVKFNPCDHAWRPAIAKKDVAVPTFEELAAIILAAERREFMRGVCFMVAAGSAMRRGELAGLRWSRVNPDTRELVVDTASVLGGQLKGTKSGNKGRVTMQAEPVEALRRLHARQLADFRSMHRDPPADWFVFARPPFEKPVHEDTLGNWFEQACEDAGVKGYTLHSLRHWAISSALARGVAPTDVQAMSRHLSLKTMLDVYGHALSDAAGRATGALELPTLRALEAGDDA